MKAEKKEAVFNAGPFQSYWWADEHMIVHPAIKARLDHKVDGAALAKAFEGMKKVYPLLELVPDDKDKELVFYNGEGKSHPVESAVSLRPCTEATLFRGLSLTYSGKTVTLSAYHSLVDEIGLVEVFKTLMNYYLAACTDTDPSSPFVMMKEGREPESYFVQNTMLLATDYTPVPLILHRNIQEIFNDEKIAEPEPDKITVGELKVPWTAYETLCRENACAMDELFVAVMARAIYQMYPEEQRKLCFGVMTDFRETFGVPETIAPCSKRMPLLLSREEAAGRPLKDVVARIRDIRALQKQPDYVKSHVAMENTYGLLEIRNTCLALNFAGVFELGEKTSRIRDISLTDSVLRSACLVRLGNILKICLQYGCETEKYANAVAAVLAELGLVSEAGIYALEADTKEAVLLKKETGT